MYKLSGLRNIYFYFLYFPRPFQYLLRGLLFFEIKSIFAFLLLFVSLVWGLLSLVYGESDHRYVLADLYIDFGLVYWIFNTGRGRNIYNRNFGMNFFLIYLFFIVYMLIYNLNFIISDWRGDRLLSFFNGAAGVIIMSFGLNYMLWKKKIFWIFVFLILIFLSKSRMALIAPFVSYSFVRLFSKWPATIRLLTVVFLGFVFTSFLWLPLTDINSTGRFIVWFNIIQEQDSIFWYGDIFNALEGVSESEDQLHNLFLHLFLSRGIYVYFLIVVIVLIKLFYLIRQGSRYSFSLLLCFLLHSTTDNVVLYPFLIPFVL